MPNPDGVTLAGEPLDLSAYFRLESGKRYLLQNQSPGGSRMFVRQDVTAPAPTSPAFAVKPGEHITFTLDPGDILYAWTEQGEGCYIVLGETQ